MFKIRTNNIHSKVKVLGKISLREHPKIILGNNVTFFPNCIIWGNGILKIGSNTAIGDNVIINVSTEAGIEIGNDCLIAANCYLIDCNHNISKNIKIRKQGFNFKKIKIMDDVWIGTNSTVVGGTLLNNGCVVGANSFVNKNFKENSVVAGCPAKIIKERI